MYHRHLVQLFAAIGVAIGMSGCAATDQFADRSTHYNLQLEQSQDQAILLNVLRASNRRPFMFTELAVSAAGTPSGSLGMSIPFALNKGTSASTLTPNLSLSGGPTLSVTPLDTQEFYQGILKPIPASTIDLLVQRGISRDLLFNLLFSRVVIHRLGAPDDSDTVRTITATNYVGNENQITAYQGLIRALLQLGLTTAADQTDAASYGPPLAANDLDHGDLVARTAAAGLQMKKFAWCDLDGAERHYISAKQRHPLTGAEAKSLNDKCDKLAAADPYGAASASPKAQQQLIDAQLEKRGFPTVFYRMQKADSSQSFRLCFAPTADADPDNLSDVKHAYCSHAKASAGGRRDNEAELSAAFITASSSRRKLAPGTPDPLCEAVKALVGAGDPLDCTKPDWSGEGFKFDFVPRSTYGVVYYLGEVSRPQINDAHHAEVPVEVDCPQPKAGVTAANSGSGCKPLFRVTKGTNAKGFISVQYDGAIYSLPDANTGYTYEVLDIVNELLSLNKLAKDLPTSNILTVLGVP